MIRIGDFSKLSRISIRMLRHYNEIGLLMPKSTDDFTGYRYYSADQLPLANRIGALKEMGFSLASIAEILEEYENPEALKKFLALKYSEVKEEAEDIRRKMMLIENTVKKLEKDGLIMNYNVILKEMPKRYVASVRKIISSYSDEGTLWEIMMNETASLNLKWETPGNAVAVFHDDGYKENDADVEVQMSVIGSYKDTENVRFKTVEPILVLSVTYKGSYEQMPAVSQAIADRAAEEGCEFDGAMFNIYHVSPATEKNPENWVTEVCFPVKKK